MKVVASRGVGSGFIYAVEDDTAFVVTNQHVIGGEGNIDVQVGGSRTYQAILLGSDAEIDVAVVAICCSQDFLALPVETEAQPEIGDDIVAVGFTRASSTSVTATVGKVTEYRTFADMISAIFHDAPLNLGNSGGPLFSMEGKVLGLNTGRVRTNPGIGIALAYQSIEELLDDWKSRLVLTPETPTPAET